MFSVKANNSTGVNTIPQSTLSTTSKATVGPKITDNSTQDHFIYNPLKKIMQSDVNPILNSVLSPLITKPDEINLTNPLDNDKN